ncbi:IS5 family transposase [Candidatus Dependentiae bacterium]|nr:IS5 family transposase [Candidatus Dependentiae bacterium]
MISENIWNEIKNIIPEKKSKVGRPLKDPKIVLSGVFYVMKTGVQWHKLPDYYGRPTSVHGRFRTWVKSGIFNEILNKSIDVAIKQLGFPECFFNDTASIKAPFAKFGGKNPTDRAKNSVKKGIIIDWNRIILSILVEPANIHDSKLLLPHIENLKKFLNNKPKFMATDSAWDVKKLLSELVKSNRALHAAKNVRRNKLKKKIRPERGWTIEQVFDIQHWNRGIKFFWTKTKDSFLALCQFALVIHIFRLVGIFG